MRVNTLARAAPPCARIACARPHHVRRIRVVARQLQRVVRLDAAADIERAAVIQRPAAVVGLVRAQVDGDLRSSAGIDLVQEVHHQDVFGRDGAVRLELEQPVALRALAGQQRSRAARDGAVERRAVHQARAGARRACAEGRAVIARDRQRARCDSMAGSPFAAQRALRRDSRTRAASVCPRLARLSNGAAGRQRTARAGRRQRQSARRPNRTGARSSQSLRDRGVGRAAGSWPPPRARPSPARRW